MWKTISSEGLIRFAVPGASGQVKTALVAAVAVAAVRFLTRTFRNVFYVRVGKRYVRLWRGVRSARERSFEEASSETEVGRRPLAPEPRPLPPLALAPRTRPAATQTEPQLEAATSAGVILPETGQLLLLCSQHCRQTRATCKSASF